MSGCEQVEQLRNACYACCSHAALDELALRPLCVCCSQACQCSTVQNNGSCKMASPHASLGSNLFMSPVPLPCRPVQGRLPTVVQNALRSLHASTCKVPHALAQLPRQQLAAVGALHVPAGHAAWQAPLRLQPWLLDHVILCLCFGHSILEQMSIELLYAAQAGTEESKATSISR